MSAFNFPSPPVADGTEVTNSATGVTYKYDASADSWSVVSTEIAVDINGQVSQLSADIARIDGLIVEELETRDELIEDATDLNASQESRLDALEAANVTYQISTDKVLRAGEPAIELVDSDGNFSNVKFEATGGLTVSSTASSIIFDGSAIDVGEVNLDNYYTKQEVDQVDQHLQAQVDELTVTKGVAAVYTLNDIGIQVGIRPGDFYIDNTVAKLTSFIALAPLDNNNNDRPIGEVGDIIELVSQTNRAYRYEITTASDGVAGVSFLVAADPDDLLIPGAKFSSYIYPQNKTTASIDYVDAGLANKMGLTGNQEVTPTWRIKDTDRTYIRIQDQELSLFNVSYPTSEKHAANQQYVNDEVAKYLPLTSGTLSGQLTIDTDSNGKINLTGTDNCDIRRNGTYVVSLQEDKIGISKDVDLNIHKIINLGTPTADNDATTKAYVDGLGEIYYGNISPAGADVNNGDLWVDSGNMRLLMRAAGAWVNPDREADTNDFKLNATPNGRKFGFSSGTGHVTKKINYFDSSGLKLRLSNTDYYGIKWNDGGITEDVTMSNGPYFTIWEEVDGTNHKIIRQGRVSRIDYHTNDILCHLSSHRTNGSFSTSKQYWVSIGGII